MAFTPVHSLKILSRPFKLTPTKITCKLSPTNVPRNAISVIDVHKQSDKVRTFSSPNAWPQVNDVSPHSPRFRNEDCSTCLHEPHSVNACCSLGGFEKCSVLKCEIQMKYSHSPGDVSFNTPDRSCLPTVINKKKGKYSLGNGAFGVVLRGNYKGEKVAVKVVDKMKLLSLRNEANGLTLNHSNIIRIFKIITEVEYGFILMERNFGPNIHEYLHVLCIPLAPSDRIRYVLNIANALDYCHKNGVLHLDVKPKNILLSLSKNICKLCDFGCSVRIEDIHQSYLKEINFGVNTVSYTDPQLLVGELPSSKSDVYSFGITMWQMISHEIPYEGINCHTIIYKVVSENYRPKEISAKMKHDAKYIELYKSCWQTEPHLRPMIVSIAEEIKTILLEGNL